MDDAFDLIDISIHSARVGGDRERPHVANVQQHFNPLRPCGRRRHRDMEGAQQAVISIHSARVGGDYVWPL